MSDNNSRHKLTEHLARVAPAVLFLAGCFLLLVFMGRKEARASYPFLQLQRLANHGEEIKRNMETFLKAGVPLHQYAGFPSLSAPFLKADPWIREIQVTDTTGRILFLSASGETPSTEQEYVPNFQPEAEPIVERDAIFEPSKQEAFYQVSLPLENKFETVGHLVLVTPKSLVEAKIGRNFSSLSVILGGLVLLFGVFVFYVRVIRGRTGRTELLVAYLLTFTLASLFVNRSLLHLYADGIQARTEALANSLASRLNEAFSLNLDVEDFSGIEEELARAGKTNPDIEYIGYVENGTIRLDTSENPPDAAWQSPKGYDYYQSKLKFQKNGAAFVVVSVPDSIISSQFWHIIKHYSVLFGLTLILSGLLLWLVDYYLIVGFETLVIPAVFVMSLSFVLLFYVGVGEAYRGYPRLQLEKLAAQGETVKQTMETFLKAGVPLKQFVGFNTLTETILASDRDIEEIQVTDVNDQLVFFNASERDDRDTESQFESNLTESSFEILNADQSSGKKYVFSEDRESYRVTLPLNNKFEEVGKLILTLPSSVISEKIGSAFRKLAIWMLGLIVLFSIFVYIDDKYLPDADYLHIAHAVIFLLAASLVVYTLTGIYSLGIQGKTRALSISIGKRLDSATELGLPLTSFSGIGATFRDYKDANPELHAVTLVEDNHVKIHTDEGRVGSVWRLSDDFFGYQTPLAVSHGPGEEPVKDNHVSVSIPKNFVYGKLWRSIKNFLVLFVATAFLASLFHTLMDTLSKRRKLAEEGALESEAGVRDEINLVLIKILYFFVVFMEGLFASYLPQYLQRIALSNGMEAGSASLLFTAYFAAFAISLIPSGNYAEKHGVKALMLAGIGLSITSVYLMTVVGDFYLMMVLRILAGLGQGMIFIGVQSFVLQVTSKGKTTQGTSIIVFGYNTGMISGTAIGALLVIYMGSERVFMLGALIGVFILSFILFLVPNVQSQRDTSADKPSFAASVSAYLKNLASLFKDFQFLKTIFLIGITTKATLTGVIVYALPLIMARLNYPQDDIGQVLMFYAGGVLISNVFIPKLADKMGNTAKILFWGALGSGAGIILTGLIEQSFFAESGIPFLSTILLIVGISLLGIAHGFIHAPIVTHIAQTRAAEVLGKSTATSIYRFLERIGHVIGPLFVGYVLVLNDYRSMTFAYIGFALVVFGVLFFVLKFPGRTKNLEGVEK